MYKYGTHLRSTNKQSPKQPSKHKATKQPSKPISNTHQSQRIRSAICVALPADRIITTKHNTRQHHHRHGHVYPTARFIFVFYCRTSYCLRPSSELHSCHNWDNVDVWNWNWNVLTCRMAVSLSSKPRTRRRPRALWVATSVIFCLLFTRQLSVIFLAHFHKNDGSFCFSFLMVGLSLTLSVLCARNLAKVGSCAIFF